MPVTNHQLLQILENVAHSLKRIEHSLQVLIHRPTNLSLWLKTPDERYHSRRIMATKGQTAVATVTETDAQGTSVPVVGANLTFTSSDPTIASVTSNGDGTATVTAVAEGTATITATDTVNGLTGTATVTVTADASTGTPGTPVGLSLTLGEFSTPAAASSAS